MCAQRLWPTVQALGRSFVVSKSEIVQCSVKAYNAQNFAGHHTLAVQPCASNSDLHCWTQNLIRTPQGICNKVLSQNFQTGSVLYIKEFGESENEHAHSVLRSLPAYSATTVADIDISINMSGLQISSYDPATLQDYSSLGKEDIISSFLKISATSKSNNYNMESEEFNQIFAALTKEVPNFDYNEILAVLAGLTLWPPTTSTTTPNFMKLWNALDKTCTCRLSAWGISEMLLVADHWYALRLFRITSYNTKMLRNLGNSISRLNAPQLVQLLFYANLGRQFQGHVSELEKRILQIIDDISIEEIGVIAMGFFKTQTFLKNIKLIEAIIVKTIQNISVVSSTSLCAILKLLRKSTPAGLWKTLQSLLDKLVPQVPRLNHMCLLQAALVGNDLLLFHATLVNEIVKVFSNVISEVRLKDLERLAFVLMLYNFVPPGRPDIFMLIANELRRQERITEIHHYPKSFVSCVAYLVTMGMFPLDLISVCLQPDMMKLLSSSSNFYMDMIREVNEIDWAMEIEGPPNYYGYRLNKEIRDNITKKYLSRIPKIVDKNLTHHERLILDVRDQLASLMGSTEFVSITNVLPHVQMSDIVFCTNAQGDPYPIPQKYLEQPQTSLKIPVASSEKLYWNAVIVCGRNSMIRNTHMYRGSILLKKRQLEKLGYYVSEVPYLNYMHQSMEVRRNVLESHLKSSTLNLSKRTAAVRSPSKDEQSARSY